MYDPRSLSEQADQLLARTVRDPSRPHYTTATFNRKLRLARQREGAFKATFSPLSDATLYLQRSDLARAVNDADMTHRQREVFCARVSGDTWVEIGRRHGHTKQGAFQIFKQALRKLKRVLRNNPFRGLHQVYKQEVSRFAPSRLGRAR